jgi:hypothetical protein
MGQGRRRGGDDEARRNAEFVRREFERLRREGALSGPPRLAEEAARLGPRVVGALPLSDGPGLLRRLRDPRLALPGAAVLLALLGIVAGWVRRRRARTAALSRALAGWHEGAGSGHWQPFRELMTEDAARAFAGAVPDGQRLSVDAVRPMPGGREVTIEYRTHRGAGGGSEGAHLLVLELDEAGVRALRHYVRP